jgi:hypothetical protein
VELAATGEWGEAAVSARMASQPVLLLDHFEYRMDDPACNERKLTLLERLAGDGRKSIHILSAFDPIPYLTAAGPAGGPAPLARWLAALSSFRRTAADDRPGPTPAFQQALVDFSSRLSSQLDPQTVHRLQKCFLQECGATASLQALGAEIAATLSPQTALDIQQLVGLIADRAAAYYATLWESSSRAEKAALAQLAQSGMVNPNNRDAIGQLCQRGLVQRNPAFSLMNESFRRFLLSALKQHEVARWEREAANQTWSTVKIIYLTALLAGIVFVALTQRETLQSWLPYLTGLGGTLVPGLTRLMSASLGSRDGPAPGSA